jgi:hypothetical protein
MVEVVHTASECKVLGTATSTSEAASTEPGVLEQIAKAQKFKVLTSKR